MKVWLRQKRKSLGDFFYNWEEFAAKTGKDNVLE